MEGKSSVDETQSRKRKRTDEAGEGEEGAGGRGTNKSVRLDLQSLEKGAQGMSKFCQCTYKIPYNSLCRCLFCKCTCMYEYGFL